MKGGVTYVDMEERRRALEFLRWMEKVAPDTIAALRSVFDQEHPRCTEVGTSCTEVTTARTCS